MKKQRWQDWITTLVGLYVFLSPWILGFSDAGALVWSSVISGVILIAMAAGAIRQVRLPSHRRAYERKAPMPGRTN